MGNYESTMVQKEKVTWPCDLDGHELSINTALHTEQVPLVDKFGTSLFLFKHQITCGNLENFWHFFVSDGTWTIEFGDEQWDCKTVPEFRVKVHNREIPPDSVEEKQFTKTDAVAERMREVCGACNYSLCFRNSEHLSRYRWGLLVQLSNASWNSDAQAVQKLHGGSSSEAPEF
eukprot:TRINITY_DN44938_c0_g1_i1.p1 TRINITY_DN44938_c0_g1~~TRINITY_DN44938_c0_g1_i1.p1  ORF type:complete len:174 (-),score=31.32 TRINITY_DN44938_c0_g1_i1:98-619(-)